MGDGIHGAGRRHMDAPGFGTYLALGNARLPELGIPPSLPVMSAASLR